LEAKGNLVQRLRGELLIKNYAVNEKNGGINFDLRSCFNKQWPKIRVFTKFFCFFWRCWCL